MLDALARALRLDEAEREHLFALARAAEPGRRRPPSTVRPAVQHVLDAIADAPAWVRNGRHDILALNRLGRALYAPVLADARRPANTTRFIYLDPAAREFFVDWDRIAGDAAAMLRLEAGRAPHDRKLIERGARHALSGHARGGERVVVRSAERFPQLPAAHTG